TDVWVEFNVQWLLYSPMWFRAVTNNRTRQIMLGGLDTEKFVKLIGSINFDVQKAFQDKLVELTRKARKMRIKCEAGTDVTFEMDPASPITNEIDYSTPGAHFLVGQIGWAPVEETVNGRIVFDASLSGGEPVEFAPLPPGERVTFIVKGGRIVEIEGGIVANITKKWFESLNDPNMYRLAHVCYGVHPYAKLGPVTAENERIWGAINFGFGSRGPMYGKPFQAKSHIDGVCLNCSVWLDDVQVWDSGRVVHPELKELARQLGKE
ncbi:MAG: hypothetical protein QW700_05105, partial [Desulfurococcaceae archaeon]